MNIHDIYLAYIFVNSDINYIDYGKTNYSGKYVRKTFVIRNKKKYSFDSVTYTDLISGNILKASLGDCEVGEEYVNHKQEFEPLLSFLGLSPYESKYNNISRKQVLKLISDKIKQDQYIKDNPDKVISFDKVKDRVSQKPKVRNKLISRIMRLKNKNDKGEKR